MKKTSFFVTLLILLMGGVYIVQSGLLASSVSLLQNPICKTVVNISGGDAGYELDFTDTAYYTDERVFAFEEMGIHFPADKMIAAGYFIEDGERTDCEPLELMGDAKSESGETRGCMVSGYVDSIFTCENHGVRIDTICDSNGYTMRSFACGGEHEESGKDYDNDGISNNDDNCPSFRNPEQEDEDQDGVGDHCDIDKDNDSVNDYDDNCPELSNTHQQNHDDDEKGDACDDDDDNDGVTDLTDNCLFVSNPQQEDIDSDGIGDLCEDQDSDGIYDTIDACADTTLGTVVDAQGCSYDQRDDDNDGVVG